MSGTEFSDLLLKEVLKNLDNSYTDNYDIVQLGPEAKPSHSKAILRLKDFLRPYKHLAQRKTTLSTAVKNNFQSFRGLFSDNRYYSQILEQFSDIEYLYSRLNDDRSKTLLLKILAYKVLGHKRVKLPLNNPNYWEGIELLRKSVKDEPGIFIESMKLNLKTISLEHSGFNLETRATPEGASCVFVQKQYEYRNDKVVCKADDSDYVIDAGGCWGETSLYFAHEVGSLGKVYTFEFIPSNIKIMQENFTKNPALKDRIEIVESPVWKHSGMKLFYVDRGPGSFVSTTKTDENFMGCLTLSIDDLVKIRKIPKINFIKMDIEGAELDSLHGAKNTIQVFKPKLAISIYHQTADFTTIPKYIDSLGVAYDFYLDHHTIHLGETVLFCVPRK